MNSRHRRHPDYVRPRLRSTREFELYSRSHAQNEANADATALAQAIARKHCAGRKGTVTGTEILEAFRSGPDPENNGSQAIIWMLDTMSIAECTKVIIRCGIRYEDVARYVRKKPQQRDELVRYLNQFTIRSDG